MMQDLKKLYVTIQHKNIKFSVVVCYNSNILL